MNKEIGYFDVLKSVITKQRIDEDSINKHFVPFMALTWVSADPKTCYETNELNTARGLSYIPKIDEYKFLRSKIKLPKNKYIPFDKNDKHYNTIVSVIADYFRIGKVTAEEYIKMMGGERVIEILEIIGQINNTYTNDKRILSVREALSKKKAYLKKIKGIKWVD